MKKKSTLAAGIKAAAGKQPMAAPAQQKKTPPALVLIGFHYPPAVRNALKMAEAKSGKRLKPLMGEAINYICTKYGVPQPCSEEA